MRDSTNAERNWHTAEPGHEHTQRPEEERRVEARSRDTDWDEGNERSFGGGYVGERGMNAGFQAGAGGSGPYARSGIDPQSGRAGEWYAPPEHGHGGQRSFLGPGELGGRMEGGRESYAPGGWGERERSRGDDWTVPGPFTGRGPQGYRRSEAAIYDDVCERLTRHGALDATGIEVKIDNGEVILEGTVDDRRAKRLAEDVAESVSGVRDVHNRLRLSDRTRDGDTRNGGA